MGNNKVVTCKACGERVSRENDYAFRRFTRVKSRSGGEFFLCPVCAQGRRRVDMQVNQKLVIGKPKAHGWRYGFELESTLGKETLFLYESNFKAKHDGSVNGDSFEWVSPIYEGLNGIPKVLSTFEKDIDIAEAIDSSCGTHVHISNHDSQWNEFVYFLAEYKDDSFDMFFNKMKDYMKANREETEKVWGRYFSGYYKSYRDSDEGDCDRYVWLNPSARHKTLEYRISKLVSKEQFMKLFNIITDVTKVAFEAYKEGQRDMNDEILHAYKKSIAKNYA